MKTQESKIGLRNSERLDLVRNEQDAHDADTESVTMVFDSRILEHLMSQ